MKKSSKVVPVFLFLSFLLLFSALSYVKAEEANSVTELSALAAHLRSAYLAEKAEQNNHFHGSETANNEQLAIAGTEFGDFLQYLRTHPNDILWEHYAGAYADPDGRITVKLNCQDNVCYNRIKELLPHAAIEYAPSGRAFMPLEAIYTKTNERISELNTRILTEKEVSSAERDLMAAYPAVQLDERTNRLIIWFSQESNDKELPEEEYLAVCRKLFEQVIGVYEVDEYCLVPERELIFDTFSSPVKAGRGIFVVTAVNGNQITYSTASLGFRAKYVSSGVTHWGFVSCGHGSAKNKEVYLTTAFNTNVYFGEVIAIKN